MTFFIIIMTEIESYPKETLKTKDNIIIDLSENLDYNVK